MTKHEKKLVKQLKDALEDMRKLIDEICQMDGVSTDPDKKVVPLFNASGEYNV